MFNLLLIPLKLIPYIISFNETLTKGYIEVSAHKLIISSTKALVVVNQKVLDNVNELHNFFNQYKLSNSIFSLEKLNETLTFLICSHFKVNSIEEVEEMFDLDVDDGEAAFSIFTMEEISFFLNNNVGSSLYDKATSFVLEIEK